MTAGRGPKDAQLLISAYACHPTEGSEPGAGWAWLRAASAVVGHVTLLTRANNTAVVSAALREYGVFNVTVVGFDLSPVSLRLKRLFRSQRVYYALWQFRARKCALALNRMHTFDLVHHVTYASDWLAPAAISLLKAPKIIGPVGGAMRFPLGQRAHYSREARWKARVRDRLTHYLRRHVAASALRDAGIVIAQSMETVEELKTLGISSCLEPNVALDLDMLDPLISVRSQWAAQPATGPMRALYLGRLEEWKGICLAIEAVAAARTPWRLDVVGEGSAEKRARQLTEHLRIRDRVNFSGKRTRDEALKWLATTDALILPSVMDSAGWALAEALTIGVPTICIASGGPALIASTAPCPPLPMSDAIIPDMAAELDRLQRQGRVCEPMGRWTAERLPGFLQQAYAQLLVGP